MGTVWVKERDEWVWKRAGEIFKLLGRSRSEMVLDYLYSVVESHDGIDIAAKRKIEGIQKELREIEARKNDIEGKIQRP